MAEDYILNVVDKTSKLDWAFPFQRTGAFPLDRSSLFSSYADAVLYASGGEDARGLSGSSYVGQPISVYDAETNSVTLYVIQANRSLKEVGSVPVGDNLSIEVKDGIIQLKNFGKNYYAYVPAVKDPEGNITEASKYTLTEGFKAGLEPRVVSTEDGLAIAWYEPGTETVEDVAANIESVSKTVDSLDQTLNSKGGLVDQVGDLKTQVGTAANEAGSGATGLYAEIDRIDGELANKPNADDVTREIAEAVAGANHLKREIVEQLPPIEDADQNTIYMIPSGLQEDDNKYYEWILINGIFERVGSWEVNLSNYATKADINTLTETVNSNKSEIDTSISDLQGQITSEVSRATAAEKVNADTISEFKTTTNNSLGEIRNSLAALEGAEPNFISSVDGNNFTVIDGKLEFKSSAGRLITSEEVAIIKNVSDGAYENFIKSVDETELNVDNAGKLTITSLPSSKITDLTSLLNTKADKTVVEAIDARVANIEDILTWKDL